MTSAEYREILCAMTDAERKELSAEIYVGGQTDVESMVKILENVPQKEAVVVRWIRRNVPGPQVKTESEKVAEASIRSAELGEQSLAVSQTSLRVSQKSLAAAYWALVVAILALLVSAVAMIK